MLFVVCDATVSYLNKLSHLISEILIHILWKNEEENCSSTEELLADIDELNQKHFSSDYFVGSADVVGLYPSLGIDFVVGVIGYMLIQSEINIEGVDFEELGLYLSLTCDKQYLVEVGVSAWCPTRKTNLGRKPRIIAHANRDSKSSRFEI